MRYRLLQARDPGDPVKEEERAAFAARLGVPLDDVIAHDLLSDATSFAAVTEGVDAVLVGGSGEYSVYDDAPWLPAFFQTLAELAKANFPTFASCFGFQGLVVGLGGTVEKDTDRAEVGTFTVSLTEEGKNDPIFSQLPAQFEAQLGHKDHAIQWPEGAVCLAASPRCPFQALRVGTRVYATQFHPELTLQDNLSRLYRYHDHYVSNFGEDGFRELEAQFHAAEDSTKLMGWFQEALKSGAL